VETVYRWARRCLGILQPVVCFANGGPGRDELYGGAGFDVVSDGDRDGAAGDAGPLVVQLQRDVRRLRQVAAAGVPGRVPLVEHHLVPARREGPQQRPVGGGVPVPPARRDRQAEDDQLHATLSTGARRMASIRSARWA
jgi:hypothetical protein